MIKQRGLHKSPSSSSHVNSTKKNKNTTSGKAVHVLPVLNCYFNGMILSSGGLSC